MRPRVVKLGGSLLTWAELQPSLQSWLDRHPHPCTLLVVGGGQVIDAVRDYDRIHQLDPAFVHWLCIDLLEASASMVEHIFPNFAKLQTWDLLSDFVAHRHPAAVAGVAHVRGFYSAGQADSRLPLDWNTTTDSLAALLALRVAASELVLMKSSDPPANCQTLERLAASEFVDAAFPSIAASLNYSIVNLRHSSSHAPREKAQ